MNRFSKILTGAAAAALVTVSAAAPAEARYRRHNDGIDAGDIITGVAIIGGIAAIASAIGNGNRGRYDRGYGDDYGDDYGYRGGERNAVGACTAEAQRHGRGRVQITDVDRRGNGYLVRGVIESGDYDYRDRDYGYGDDRYGRQDRGSFACVARSNGRVTDFRTNDGYRG